MLTLLIAGTLLFAQSPIEERDLARHFPGYSACLLVLDAGSGRIVRHGGAQCAKPLSPCSTFKIPNSLIALDTGVADGPEFFLKWDGVKRDRPELNHDHTLRTAIRDSVVWYYQELARRVGSERMQRLVDTFDYGNRDISSGVDTFWLGSSLKISADQQLRFLERLQKGTLPVSARSQQIVRDITRQPWSDGVDYHGKTGSCGFADGTSHGWWVGFVTRGGRSHAFAANIIGKQATGRKLRPMVEQALVELGVLPARSGER
jgi:beta-lactamase class D